MVDCIWGVLLLNTPVPAHLFAPHANLHRCQQQQIRAIEVQLHRLPRMRARGIERVCVSATGTNTPALRLYGPVGFRVVNAYLAYVKMA